MTSAHFENESIEALLSARDFIVRENIKGTRKKNPKLDKDRSLIIGEPTTDLSEAVARIKPMESKEELLKHFGKARYSQPEIITATCDFGLESDTVKNVLALLETQGHMIIKYHQMTDMHTADLLEFLAAVFHRVVVLNTLCTTQMIFYVVCSDFNKDIYQGLQPALDKSYSGVRTIDYRDKLCQFNRQVYVKLLRGSDTTPEKERVGEWLENLVECT